MSLFLSFLTIAITVIGIEGMSICGLPFDPGPCRGRYSRWYYNGSTNTCEKFIYGGCGGNRNNFQSRFKCFRQFATCIREQVVRIPEDAECLRQTDFEMGTKIISEPGNYKLCEDIYFHPNTLEFDPPFDGPHRYSPNAYGLGFFSAIAIASSNVNLFLNDYTIEQSAGHALMQRFFAVIELASTPFIESAGPAQFVGDDEQFSPGEKISIIGPGTIGLSSHHGIHGNDNKDITISRVVFRDFEVAAVSLNNADNVKIQNCYVAKNRQDVPVVGLFSAARFLRPYGKILKEKIYSMDIRGEHKSAADLYNNLVSSIENVYTDVIYGSGYINKALHPQEYELFHNPFGAVDGPCYAFLIHGKGPAVWGMGENFNETDSGVTSSNIIINGNNIQNMTCWNNEVPAVVESNVVLNDVRGAVLQLVNTFNFEKPDLAINSDGTYKGNVVADMQIMVAAAVLDGVLVNTPECQIVVNSISQEIIEWAKSGTTIYTPQYRCNGDSMHHVMKGIVVIRVEDTKGFSIQDNTIMNVVNLSVEPFGMCQDFHQEASVENEDEQQAGNIRAISVAAVRGYDEPDRSRSMIMNNKILDLSSEEAKVIIGIDVQGDSKQTIITGNIVNLQNGVGKDPHDKYISLRCRQFVTTEGPWHDRVIYEHNYFLQETYTERPSTDEIHGRRMSGDIEWKTAGCPFASQLNNK